MKAATTPAAAAPAATPTPIVRTGNSKDLILATTTSTQDSGLLDTLIPLFQQQTGYNVKTIAVGSGQALALGDKGEADVLLVHSPDAEVTFMKTNPGSKRTLVMHNDFIVVGPSDDPAKVKDSTTAADALTKIANAKSPFISRGDNSGTNALEIKLWGQAKIDPKGQSWYQSTGQGMGATLNVAAEKNAYTISDRATWLANQKNLSNLTILLQGQKELLNIYHVITVDSSKSSQVNTAGAQAFADFLVSQSTQDVISKFGVDKYGQQLFYPDAGKNEADLGK